MSSKNSSESLIHSLSNPHLHQANLDITGYEKPCLITILSSMILIRLAEKKIAQNREAGLIGGPVHLAAGQESIAVGVSLSLNQSDMVFGTHRSHSHILALGTPVVSLFAEVLGRSTGLSKGMGGSMHLLDKSIGFHGSVPIVAGTVPIAAGAALASKLRQLDYVAVSYLGDGAVEEGVVHETLNLASVLKVPLLFVVENNLFSSHMHISQRQPLSTTTRFALANNIRHELVDGNNVLEVARSAKRLIQSCRDGNGPAFLEAVTHRQYGHVDWRTDIDVGINRSSTDIALWLRRDPILRLSRTLIDLNLLTEEELSEINSRISGTIDDDWEHALMDPYPPADQLLSAVYHPDNL